MNIVNLENHNFDTSKTVLLCGKGPSALDAPRYTNNKYIAALTGAYKIFPKADFLFCNDVDFFKDVPLGDIVASQMDISSGAPRFPPHLITDEITKTTTEKQIPIAKVDNIIVPILLNITLLGLAGLDHSITTLKDHYFKNVLEDIPEDIDVYTHTLESQLISQKFSSLCECRECGRRYLVGDVFELGFSAIKQKYDCFSLSTYHTALYWLIKAGFKNFEIFGVSQKREYSMPTVNPADNSWYKQNYQMGIDILEAADCNYKINE